MLPLVVVAGYGSVATEWTTVKATESVSLGNRIPVLPLFLLYLGLAPLSILVCALGESLLGG